MDRPAKMEAVTSSSSRDKIDTNLIQRLSVDAAAAMIAAISVSPIMAIIDRGVTEAATGRISTFHSMRLALRESLHKPHLFLTSLPFRSMLLLYAGTYLTANTIDTLSAYADSLPPATTTSSTTKLAAVTTLNVALALYKDATFARTFGSPSSSSSAAGKSKSKSLPPICYIPFIARDAITLFATFNAPALLAPHVPDSIVEAHMSKLTIMQIAAPAASQFVGTPLHLLGLDLYYRQGGGSSKVGWRERWEVIRRLWGSASVARACRVVPAYGLGGVINNDARRGMMGWVVE